MENPFSANRLSDVLLPGAAQPHHGPSAAVAAAVRDGDHGAEILFIERSAKKGDPWSGQMAFPGGRTSPTDADSVATAIRETKEELDIDLSGTQVLGRLSDLEGGPRGSRQRLRVTPHLFWMSGRRPTITLNHEVAAAIWVPVEQLVDKKRYVDYPYPPLGSDLWPGIAVEGERIIWGLTLRMLVDLFIRLGQPLSIGP
ncbi:MAG: CoA pyrophosphatase [Actinomycetota bacterium]|nr:CoA pyrophosphatase [Acidimicrobiales bacterium]MEC9316830.1 CoA pyrophosphatase [Actinomycetota bacterium]MED5551605.1 CoA pyrophosphatase [Actinomycetota bacterium]MEE3186771.1 CoA pyrophosphatase [Actinomycetota bacterium]